jgi:hypothetical protein
LRKVDDRAQKFAWNERSGSGAGAWMGHEFEADKERENGQHYGFRRRLLFNDGSVASWQKSTRALFAQGRHQANSDNEAKKQVYIIDSQHRAATNQRAMTYVCT